MANILEIKNLVVSYGGIEAVKGIDLTVEEGKIVTLVGSNGAGKSTTLKSIAGLVKPKSGDILFNGQSLLGKSTDQIVSTGVTLVPEGRRVFPNLTVEENLRIGAYLRKDSIKEDMEKVYELKDAEKTEELYKYLLIVQCNALNKILPGMFQKIADYTELLLPDNLLLSDKHT